MVGVSKNLKDLEESGLFSSDGPASLTRPGAPLHLLPCANARLRESSPIDASSGTVFHSHPPLSSHLLLRLRSRSARPQALGTYFAAQWADLGVGGSALAAAFRTCKCHGQPGSTRPHDLKSTTYCSVLVVWWDFWWEFKEPKGPKKGCHSTPARSPCSTSRLVMISITILVTGS